MLIYVACWPLLAYLAGNLIPAIGSGELSKVSSIIIKSLFVFLVQMKKKEMEIKSSQLIFSFL